MSENKTVRNFYAYSVRKGFQVAGIVEAVTKGGEIRL